MAVGELVLEVGGGEGTIGEGRRIESGRATGMEEVTGGVEGLV